MSADCCGHGTTFEGLSADYKRRLWLVIALNATMFLVEMGAGGSTAYHVLILGVPRAEIMGVSIWSPTRPASSSSCGTKMAMPTCAPFGSVHAMTPLGISRS